MHQTPLFFSQLFGRRKPETESNSEERETGSNGIKLAFWLNSERLRTACHEIILQLVLAQQ